MITHSPRFVIDTTKSGASQNSHFKAQFVKVCTVVCTPQTISTLQEQHHKARLVRRDLEAGEPGHRKFSMLLVIYLVPVNFDSALERPITRFLVGTITAPNKRSLCVNYNTVIFTIK